MALSDLMVRQARAADKTYSLPDTDGLGLVVAPTGGKSWHLRYYWLGKQKRISLGNYPEISLREARALRDEARAPGQGHQSSSRSQAKAPCRQAGIGFHLQGRLRRLG